MRGPELQDDSTVFHFMFVILCIAGLLGLLSYAALHEDDDKRAVRVVSPAPRPSA
jgi:hypothetical protein